jgi:hypothetical protein
VHLSILTTLLVAVAAPPCPALPAAATVPYTLSIPEAGLDDPAAYEGYQTRFLRDAAGNTVQVYVKAGDGRVVNLLANAANESVGFTVRDGAGSPARLDWAADSACVARIGQRRVVEYRLRADGAELEIGHVLLGSMRVERDFQYPGRHLEPFGPAHVVPELRRLLDQLGRLPDPERRRHLGLLRARDLPEVEARLHPVVQVVTEGEERVVRIERSTLDGRNRLALELAAPSRDAHLDWVDGHTLRVRARDGGPLVLTVRVSTDAAPLTPLDRQDIFNAGFFAFYDSVRTASSEADDAATRFRLLERQVRGVELLSSREKLMAGLPNYATYFGRDMLVAALLMQPVWAPTMNEHVIGSVLGKLSAEGAVSHEEALGGQAIREHAAQYAALVAEGIELLDRGDTAAARRLLDRATVIIEAPQRVREAYTMVDDDFQFPVLVARYLADPAVPAARKRDFLAAPAGPNDPAPRLTLLLRNLARVADLSAPYARDPRPLNLIAFPERAPGHYHAASWRDSGAGYGNGRFAMDVNAVWVPQALEATAAILEALTVLGISVDELEGAAPSLAGSVLGSYARDPASLRRAIETWRGAAVHFRLRLDPDDARARLDRKLASLPAPEARYWGRVLESTPIPQDGIAFLALSLDGAGRPIAILNTDVATRWFLDPITDGLTRDPSAIPAALAELAGPFRDYPVGLMVDGLGPLVANDAFATPAVWAAFQEDDYHSPRVVWGREVSLVLMGLMRQIDDAHDDAGRLRDPRLRPWVDALEAALRRTTETVEASGLKHNEVWSYRIDGDRLQPIRWGASTDVQLWNLTNLAVEYLLAGR